MSSRRVGVLLAGAIALSGIGCGGDFGDASDDPVASTSQAVSAQDPADTGVGLTDNWHLFVPYGDCDNVDCDGFAPPVGTRPPKRTRGSNSQAPLPNNMALGDVDGDRQADIIQYDDNGRLFAHRADFRKSEIHHMFMRQPIQRLIVGDFHGAGWDQVCIVDPYLVCYGIDATRDDQFRLFFKQPNPIAATEDVIVGDYDGDGKDQLFLYDRVAGTFRMLIHQPNQGFVVSPTWTKTNLSRVEMPGIKFRQGDYNGDGRTDLVASNSFGQVMAFGAATTSSGHDTFFWSFTSVSNVIKSGEAYSLARADDNATDDLVIHNPSTGAVAFYRITFNGGSPPALPIHVGQLPVTANSVLAMAWSHPMRNEPGVENRDDPFLFSSNASWLRAHEARWDAANSRFTYWFEYDGPAPNNHTGWPATRTVKTLFMKCKLAGDTDEPYESILDELVERIRDYYFEVTYRRIYLSNAQDAPIGWIQMPQTYAEVTAMAQVEEISRRAVMARECAIAAGRNPDDWDAIVAFMSTSVEWGHGGGKYVTLSSTNASAFDVWASIHEIGHILGLNHTNSNNPADTNYANPWDPMSARTWGYRYTNPLGRPEGPEYSSGNRDLLGALPAKRILSVPLGAARRTVLLSALNRPATGQYLQIQLQSSNPAIYYSVEYREPSGFDRAIPRPTVLIHRVNTETRQVRLNADQDGIFSHWATAERLAGESYTLAGVATIRVVSINPALHLAEVEITPN